MNEPKKQRNIREVIAARASRDGDGVAIQRVAGMQHAGMDPILMVDELRSERREDFMGGFPPHPHRGMQTLTYMKSGGIIHRDNRGNRGEIRGGGAQWMSAGRGIIHSEMPTRDTDGLHGFQLWINLPGAEKMDPPRYRDIPRRELARAQGVNFSATAVSGLWDLSGVALHGPLVELEARASIIDITLDPGAVLSIATDKAESVIAYIYSGGLMHGESLTGSQQLVITDGGEEWVLRAGSEGASLLALRGFPIAEPVAHYGPFVMNSADEIDKAIGDYQSGHAATGFAPLQLEY